MKALSESTEKIIKDYAVENLERAETYEKYRNVVIGICEFCGKDLPLIEAADAKAYFNYCQAVKLNDESTLVFKRSVLISVASFMELHHKDYDLLPYTYSDVYRIINLNTEQYIKPEDLPRLKDIDRLFSYLMSSKNYRVLLAASLALKLALTASEILNIRYSDFIVNDKGQRFVRIRKKYPPHSYPELPDDLQNIIQLFFDNSNPLHAADSEGTVFKAKSGKPLSYRRLAEELNKSCKEAGVNITFNHLRNLSIAYMIKNGADEEDLKKVTGTVRNIYSRFNPAVESIITTPVEFNCIYIRT